MVTKPTKSHVSGQVLQLICLHDHQQTLVTIRKKNATFFKQSHATSAASQQPTNQTPPIRTSAETTNFTQKMDSLKTAQEVLAKDPNQALEITGALLSNLPSGCSKNDQALAYIIRARALEKTGDYPGAREDVLALESLAHGSASAAPVCQVTSLKLPRPENPTAKENREFYSSWAKKLVKKAQLAGGSGPTLQHAKAGDWKAVENDLKPILEHVQSHKDYDSPMLILAGYTALKTGNANKAMEYVGTWLSHANTYKAPAALTSWAHAIRAKAGEQMGEISGSIQDVMALNTLANTLDASTGAPAWVQELRLEDMKGNKVRLADKAALNAWLEQLKLAARH